MMFFSGKEAVLICIDEVMRKSISLVLAKKALAGIKAPNEDDVKAEKRLTKHVKMDELH